VCGIPIILLALAIVPSPGPQDARPTVAEIVRDYHEYRKVTPEPVTVNFELSLLCRGVYKHDIVEARRKTGPHAYSSVLIYMNEPGASAFKEKSGRYPVGAVVIKEKARLAYWVGRERDVVREPDGVGGMVKRAPGYNPEHGDWEYFYFEDPKQIESGRIESCVNCHAAAKDRDFVFGDWRKFLGPDWR
jgi:hypothetical protein